MDKKVLILCTGNSCRSIIAEALINAKLDGVSADSSGVKASGKVNPNAKKLLEEKGIWKDKYHSKTIDKVIDNSYDLVVTVCDNANETCPMFPKAVKVIHIGFEDPNGKDFESFIKIYEAIEKTLLPKVLENLSISKDNMKILKIYDPAMCCETGVCGTTVDTKLLKFANFLKSLDKNKFEVKRFGLSTIPQEYVTNSEVKRLLKEEGINCLPLIFLDEELIFKKDYPTIKELGLKLGITTIFTKA